MGYIGYWIQDTMPVADPKNIEKVHKIANGELPDEDGILVDLYMESGYRYRWDENNMELSTECFKKAAELGNATAMYEVSYNYYKTNDSENERLWLLKAAEANKPLAIFELGKDYYLGNHCQQDYNKAFELFVRAFELGDSSSAYALGVYAEDGILSPPDYEKALFYYETGAKKDNQCRKKIPSILLKLGQSKENDGITQEALEYYEKGRGLIEDDSHVWGRDIDKAIMKELILGVYRLKPFNPSSYNTFDLYYLLQKPHRVMFYYNKEVHTIRAKENDGDIVIWLDDQLVGSVDDLLESTLIGKAPFMHCDVDITWFRLQDYWVFKMDTIQFDTPFGFIEVLKNGNRIPFHIEEGTYNTYFQDDLELHPLGCYEMAIDISDMAVGDTVVVRYSKGSIASDGGDEHTLNAVGEIDGYTIGLGVTDTDDLEELWQYDKEEYPDDPRFSRDQRYPYAHWGLTGSGVEFRIVDDPGKYPDDHYDTKNIIVSAVWESNDKEYAWDIVSFLTC